MYRLGQRIRHRHFIIYVLILALLVGAGVFAVKRYFTPEPTVIARSPAKTLTVKDTTPPMQTIGGTLFTFELPKDWKSLGHSTAVDQPYVWQNTTDNPGVRKLEMYIDDIPEQMAVNRLVPVQAEGDHLGVGAVSDNCVTFTPNSQHNSAGKWAGVNFTCDTQNYERDVVGTGSSEGNNVVTLDGPTAGSHKLFFVYTDNSAQPDYTIFTNVLTSFRLK